MKPRLAISVSKKPKGGIVSCKQISVRERIIRFFLGKKVDIVVFIPGDMLDEVEIIQRR